MHQIPDNSVDLVVTSPPYNVTKEYDENLTLAEYLKLLRDVITESKRVIKSSGVLAINIANVGRKPYIPLNIYIIQIMMEIGLKVFREIIWNKEASAGSSCAWGSWQSASNPSLRDVHEYIIMATKSSEFPKVNTLEEIRQSCPTTIEGKLYKLDHAEVYSEIWKFQAESAKRVNHPAPFPVDLPLRTILLFTKPGATILDPFMGSGSVAIASIESKRHFIGYDISDDYIQNAQKRIEKLVKSKSNRALETYLN